MKHVLIAGIVHKKALARIEAEPGFSHEYIHCDDFAGAQAALGRADAIVLGTQAFGAGELGQAPRLAIVSRHGVGYDSVDGKALAARNVPLTVVGDVNSVSVAEHTLMLVLATSKRLIHHDRATRAGDWRYRETFDSMELADRLILIVGFGRIGRRVAALAAAFSMRVTIFDPFCDARTRRAAPYRFADSLESGIESADIVTLHCPASSDMPLMGPEQIAAMKPGAVLINTARGALVDEAALLDALDQGRLCAAGLDVFACEPLRAENRLLAHPCTILTPHSASLTEECALKMGIKSVENIIDYFAGTLDSGLVVNGVSPLPASA